MANYYYVEINSEKLTASLAAEILAFIGENGGVNNFNYYDGHLDYYMRGLKNISEIIRPYNFTDEEIKVKDEFEYAWTAIFEKYFVDLPITREYHSILEKNINEEVIKLDWDGENRDELEDYFKTCWGSRSFRFEPENSIIIGVKEK